MRPAQPPDLLPTGAPIKKIIGGPEVTGQDQELRQALLRYLEVVLAILRKESQPSRQQPDQSPSASKPSEPQPSPSTQQVIAKVDPKNNLELTAIEKVDWRQDSTGRGY